MSYWSHESAIIDQGAEIGDGTKVWHFTHVCGGARIGQNCSLGQNVFVGNDVKIGDRAKIQNNVSVYDSVEIEDDVFCGPSMVFTNVVNPRSHIIRKHEYLKTHVKKGATIGANATIVCGNDVGEFSFIAAGAVITKSVPPYALMAGVPAKQIGWVCQCGVRLPAHLGEQHEDLKCSECSKTYQIVDTMCSPV